MDKEWLAFPDIAPTGPTYSRAVKAGDTLYVSGCTARDTPAQGATAVEQLEVTLDRVVDVVRASGGTSSDIVKLTTFVTNMDGWFPGSDGLVEVFQKFFGDTPPANTLVEVSALAEPGLDVEIEAIAVISD